MSPGRVAASPLAELTAGHLRRGDGTVLKAVDSVGRAGHYTSTTCFHLAVHAYTPFPGFMERGFECDDAADGRYYDN